MPADPLPPGEPPAGPVVVLVGPPGSGKSTIGRLVADRLGVGFRDSDADVTATAGKPIADIFVDDGEPAFRALEEAAVATALAEHDGVLALGGGAVLAEPTRQRLAGHRVVFLSVGLADAAKRVGLGRDRPLLTLNPRAQLRAMLAARQPVYEAVASVIVPTDGRTPDDVAADVLAALPQDDRPPGAGAPTSRPPKERPPGDRPAGAGAPGVRSDAAAPRPSRHD